MIETMIETQIIIPTYKEQSNIKEAVTRIGEALKGYNYHILLVDDNSNDGSVEEIKSLQSKYFVDILVREGKRGLSRAVIRGFKETKSENITVMDIDGQHPFKLLPKVIDTLGNYELVIPSRYIKGGGTEGWSLTRKIISITANLLAKPLLPKIHDLSSGFFGVKRKILPPLTQLSPEGFKIGLEVFAKSNYKNFIEIPYIFKTRTKGESKFNKSQVFSYIKQLIKLYLFKLRSLIKFGLVGLVGSAIHFPVLYVLTEYLGLHYILSATIAIFLASTNNYILNNLWTFSKRSTGAYSIGLIKYIILSLVGDGIYLGLLTFFTEVFYLWYIYSAVMALVIVFLVKYKMADLFIWKKEVSQIGADYEWNSFYRGSLPQRIWKQKIAKVIWSWFSPKVQNNLLDIGCGSSPISFKYPGAIGIDTNENKISFMEQKLKDTKFQVMSADDLKFPNESFDKILFIEIIEHLTNPERVISEISRVLKPGGRVIIATPETSGIRGKIWSIAESFTPYKEEHIQKFSRNSLEQLCKNYKLKGERYHYVFFCDLVEEFSKR